MMDVWRLKEMNAELESIFEYSFDGILVTDAEGNILKLNDASASFMKLSKKEALGKNARDLEKLGVFNPSAVVKVMEQGNPVELVQEAIGGRYVYVRAKPIYGQHGKIERIISFTRDLTEILLLKQQLEEMEGELSKYRRDVNQEKEIPGIISNSEKMKDTIAHVRKLAEVESDVLLLGETGVGKSDIAKAIHQLSNRRDQAFNVINCAALPESLIEAELFGYTDGMFTGGVPGGKKGLFESSNGGILFLDEIGELPIHLQAKLLHVLQDKQLRPIGAAEQIPLDVRIITATNQDLRKMIRNGSFREDLYHRLNVFPITVPPLRERKEDILELTHQFLHKYNQTYQKQVRFSPKVLQCFLSYSWEGNVRELKNVIERLVVMTDDTVVKMEELPAYMRSFTHSEDDSTLKEILENVERKVILEVYEKEPSSYKVAERLGISQSAATRKIRKYLKDPQL